MSRSLLAALLLFQSGTLLDPLQPADGAGTRVFLVRHAQAYSNLDPRPEGLSDDELDHLTELGHEQAALTAAELQNRAIELVLASPAMRAQETARILAESLGVPLRVEPRLRPLELGEGQSWDQRRAEWKAGRDPSPPGGESVAEVGMRVFELAQSLPGEISGGGAAVLVAHSEVIAAYLGQLESVVPHRRLERPIANASISAVDVMANGPPLIQAENLRPEQPPD